MRAAFWRLFEESVIVQSIVTLLLVATVCYEAITVGTITPTIEKLTWVVIGFWFGQKLTFARAR